MATVPPDPDRLQAILTAYAEDVVCRDICIEELEAHISSLTADVTTYRDIGNAALDAVVYLTSENRDLQAKYRQLQDENRALWEALHIGADADVHGDDFDGVTV